MCFLNLLMKKMYIRGVCPLHPLSLFFSLSSALFHLSMLLPVCWCDTWLPWFQMFLIARMPGMACCYTPTQHSLMPHRADRTYTCTCTYIHMYTHKQTLKAMPFQRGFACMFVCLYTKCMRARVQSGVFQDETAAASCMRRETSCCLAANRGRSAKISTNQLCWGWMQEVSLTASRRKLKNIVRQHDKFNWG